MYSSITALNTLVSTVTLIVEVLMAAVAILMALSFFLFFNPFTVPLGIIVEAVGASAEILLGITLSQIQSLQRRK